MAWFGDPGSRLYYEESGSGDPIVVLPGWGGTIDEFIPLRTALESRFRVVAVDLPGSGKSEPQPRTYTPTYYHDDIPAFAALLEAIAGAPARLIGFSDGGEYALMLAARQAPAVRAVVTWGSLGYVPPVEQMADALASVVDDPIPPLQEFSSYLKTAYGEANARIMARSEGAALKAMMKSGGDLMRSRAGDVTCPVLMITGEHDFLATPALVAETAKALPDGEFVEAKGASHAVHHERSAWLVETVTSWIDAH